MVLQVTLNAKRLIAALIVAVTLTACERDMSVSMDGANPPTFKLSGSGRLIFFVVFEPAKGKPSMDDPKMWEIRPTTENLISRLPPITYGTVPPGFRQTTPSSGAPPPLIEGRIYKAGGPAFNANGGSIRFTIKDGKAIELEESR
jgi:hypothetical protein